MVKQGETRRSHETLGMGCCCACSAPFMNPAPMTQGTIPNTIASQADLSQGSQAKTDG